MAISRRKLLSKFKQFKVLVNQSFVFTIREKTDKYGEGKETKKGSENRQSQETIRAQQTSRVLRFRVALCSKGEPFS